MIKTTQLSKIFRTEMIETTALHQINMSIGKGEFVAIMGPSGCGKSTLLNILGLLDNANSGSYVFDGTDVTNLKEHERTQLRKGNIGFVFQSFNLIEDLNVFQNIELPLIAMNEPRNKRRKKVEDMLEYMQIGHRREHFPGQLSGGQQQRVAVARAFITNPKLILADEPTGNLDSQNGEQVMQMMEKLNMEGTTIVMVTHSLAHAERAHRIINLFDGRIITEQVDRVFQPILS